MRFDSLKKLLRSLFRAKNGNGKPALKPSEAPLVDPLTIGFHIDLAVPTALRKGTRASQMIWVSPTGSDFRSVRALKILIYPN